MTKYKWCVCDMDGTLLNSEGCISKENEIALKKLSNLGIEVIIASGRTDLMMKPYIKQLNLKGHIICCNGGLIKNLATNEMLYSKTINADTVFRVLQYCFNNDINFLFYTEDTVYSNEGNPRAERFEKINCSVPLELRTPISYVNIGTLEILEMKPVFKILLSCGFEQKLKELERYFNSFDELEVVSSYTGLLDIMAAETTKGNALRVLSEIQNIDLDKVIAFGDNYNDLDMFKNVGMPIAVSNAVEEIKSAAKFITTSNNDSGIAFAINNIILSNN